MYENSSKIKSFEYKNDRTNENISGNRINRNKLWNREYIKFVVLNK